MLRHAYILLLVLLNLLLASRVIGQGKTDTRFPLMAWDYVDDRVTLKAMNECGITSVAFVRPKMLDACQEFQIKCIVFDESLSGTDWTKPFNGDLFRRNFAAIARKVGNHPALLGYHIKDEPPATDFPELAKAVTAVKEFAPGKWPYINLFPGEGDTYDKYLEQFVTIVNPTALSYDRYSLYDDGSLNPIFWENLSQVRASALEHNLPFWNIVLTSPHWGYRVLSPADIRLQVYASLAYGVSGISYYKFVSKELPILNAPDLGNFRMGPLDQFGEKTITWEYLRNTNRQVHNIATVLMKLKSDDVYHFGQVPARNHGPTEKSLIKWLNGEFVVGDFTHEDGTRWVMIVNKNLTRSYPLRPQFTVTPKLTNYISPITGKIESGPSKFYWLAPGAGVLVQVQS